FWQSIQSRRIAMSDCAARRQFHQRSTATISPLCIRLRLPRSQLPRELVAHQSQVTKVNNVYGKKVMTTTPQNNGQSHLTIIEAVYEHSINNPEALAYGCISSEGTLESSLTYRDLIRRSESVAAELLRSCEPGDRAILLFHGGTEFIVSFLGCLIA